MHSTAILIEIGNLFLTTLKSVVCYTPVLHNFMIFVRLVTLSLFRLIRHRYFLPA